jgi:hypothetical protein
METKMDSDIQALRTLAQTYFDAAYDMDADRFASIFDPASAVTRLGEDGVVVTPIAGWLDVVRGAEAPRKLGLERKDEILAVDVEGNLALLKLKLQMPPKHFTDMLSCLKTADGWKIVQKVMTLELR